MFIWISCLENPRDGGAWWAASMGSHRVGHDWSDLAVAADHLNKIKCLYSFFTVLALRCYMDFSLFVQSGATLSLHYGNFSSLLLLCSTGSGQTGCQSCSTLAQQLQLPGSRAQAQYLWWTGLAAPRLLGSSWTRDWTCVSCIAGWTLYRWATKEAPPNVLLEVTGPDSEFYYASIQPQWHLSLNTQVFSTQALCILFFFLTPGWYQKGPIWHWRQAPIPTIKLKSLLPLVFQSLGNDMTGRIPDVSTSFPPKVLVEGWV